MMTEEEALREEPTRERWEVELRRLIEGERVYEVREAGSIQEYVEGVLDSSREKPVAETFFEEALRNIIQAWQPSIVEKGPRIARFLDLIAARRPAAGFPKVMEFLSFWGYGEESPVSASVHARPVDLREKALKTLGVYFPVPPPLPLGEVPGFRAYVHLLREHLERREPEYCGHAARRLLEMHVIEPDGKEIRALIRSNPAALREIVPLLLERHTALKDISSVYGLCLLAPDEATSRELEAALKSCGAAIEVPDTWPENWPELRLRNGQRMQLEMSDDIQNVYVSKQRWGKDAAGGEEFWNSVQVSEESLLGIQNLLEAPPA